MVKPQVCGASGLQEPVVAAGEAIATEMPGAAAELFVASGRGHNGHKRLLDLN